MIKTYNLPTIRHLLDSMPSEGVSTATDRMTAYATLGYHYDGIDRRTGYSVRRIKKFITELDDYAYQITGDFSVDQIDDEDADLFGCQITFPGTDHFPSGQRLIDFKSPTLQNMPKQNPNQSMFLKAAIKALAVDPDEVLNLPYTLFPGISEALGRALGFL